MTPQSPPGNGIDITRPNVARIYDYLLGGKDNFTADREAARQLIAASPDMAGIVRDNRSFIGRVVRYLAGGAGITQFTDLREPAAVLRHSEVRRLLDLARPVAVVCASVLHFVAGAEEPHRIVAARSGHPAVRAAQVAARRRRPQAMIAGQER